MERGGEEPSNGGDAEKEESLDQGRNEAREKKDEGTKSSRRSESEGRDASPLVSFQLDLRFSSSNPLFRDVESEQERAGEGPATEEEWNVSEGARKGGSKGRGRERERERERATTSVPLTFLSRRIRMPSKPTEEPCLKGGSRAGIDQVSSSMREERLAGGGRGREDDRMGRAGEGRREVKEEGWRRRDVKKENERERQTKEIGM